MKTLCNFDEFNKIIEEQKVKNNNLYLLFYTASWCGPCKFIYPLISVSKTSRMKKRNFEIKNGFLSLSKKNKENYQVNGNFFFSNKKFIVKNKTFFKDKKTIAFKIQNPKYSIDIDTIQDYKLALNFI